MERAFVSHCYFLFDCLCKQRGKSREKWTSIKALFTPLKLQREKQKWLTIWWRDLCGSQSCWKELFPGHVAIQMGAEGLHQKHSTFHLFTSPSVLLWKWVWVTQSYCGCFVAHLKRIFWCEQRNYKHFLLFHSLGGGVMETHLEITLITSGLGSRYGCRWTGHA